VDCNALAAEIVGQVAPELLPPLELEANPVLLPVVPRVRVVPVFPPVEPLTMLEPVDPVAEVPVDPLEASLPDELPPLLEDPVPGAACCPQAWESSPPKANTAQSASVRSFMDGHPPAPTPGRDRSRIKLPGRPERHKLGGPSA
jgi:hypothetical protein